MLPGPVLRRHCVQVEFVLLPRLPLDEERLAVGAPERSPEILVVIFIEIGPDGITGRNVDDTDADLRIRISAFRIAGHPHRASRWRHILKSDGSPCPLGIRKAHP